MLKLFHFVEILICYLDDHQNLAQKIVLLNTIVFTVQRYYRIYSLSSFERMNVKWFCLLHNSVAANRTHAKRIETKL